MYVIIKNIPSYITIEELESYIFPSINGGLFRKKGQIKALKIIQLIDKNGKSIERHGLVIVDSESVKKRLIKSLNPRALVNAGFFNEIYDISHCSVDEYFIRHWSNDRRSTNFTPSLLPNNQRVADRRRRGLSIVAQSEK